MDVVEDEHGVTGEVPSEGEKSGEDGVGRRREGAEEESERAVDGAGLDRLPGGQEVAEEAVGVVVVFAEGEPGDWVAAGTGPLGEQGRLAVAGGGGDEGEFRGGDVALEGGEEPGARQEATHLRGNLGFGCQEGGVHGATMWICRRPGPRIHDL